MPTMVGLDAPAAKKQKTTRKRWLPVSLGAALVLLSVGVALLAINWPFKQQALLDILQQRSARSVTVARFRITYFPPGCVAEQIAFLHRKHKDKPPLITMDKVVVRGSYWGLISPHKHVPQIRLYGMHVTVPPSNPDGSPNPVMPLTYSKNEARVAIGSIIADGTVLDFIQRTPGKPPVHLVIDKLLLDNVGNNLPLKYRAQIENPNPPGIIESTGQFGTWDVDNPAETPVHGTYRFTHGNLAVYSMLAGTLHSEGSFEGPLRAIHARGSVDVPDFQIKDTARARELKVQYDATIAATDGNVDLNTIAATFDHTMLTANGYIRSQPRERGKALSLALRSKSARIEDLLRLVISSPRSPMVGSASFDAQVGLPPGAKSFLRDMAVQGAFRIPAGQFTNPEIQQDLANIAVSAAKKDKLPTEPATPPRFGLASPFSVRNGIAQLSHLRLTMPGASATLDGPYNLVDYSMDLHGTLQTDGSPSSLATGFKSVLLKGLTPFFKKKDGQRVIPFKMQGSYHDAKVNLDLGHKQATNH